MRQIVSLSALCQKQWINEASPLLIINCGAGIRHRKSIDVESWCSKHPSWSTILHMSQDITMLMTRTKLISPWNKRHITLWKWNHLYLEWNSCFKISLPVIETWFNCRIIAVPDCFCCKLYDFIHNSISRLVACLGIVKPPLLVNWYQTNSVLNTPNMINVYVITQAIQCGWLTVIWILPNPPKWLSLKQILYFHLNNNRSR